MNFKKIYLFPIVSSVCLVIAFFLPIVKYEIAPDQFVPLWLWGFRYILFLDGINILDIPLKLIFSVIILLMIFLIRNLIILKKDSSNFEKISISWLYFGVSIIILFFLWIFWVIIIVHIPAHTPYNRIRIDLGFFFPFIGGITLILARILEKTVIRVSED